MEGVAVAAAHRGRGVARAVLERVEQELRREQRLGLLTSGRAAGLYRHLGWQRWRGRTLVARPEGDVVDRDHGALLVRALAAQVDLDADVVCEPRAGSAW